MSVPRSGPRTAVPLGRAPVGPAWRTPCIRWGSERLRHGMRIDISGRGDLRAPGVPRARWHATSRLQSRLHHAWCGPSVLALDLDGWCGGESFSGFFFREARHLSVARFELHGEEPVLGSLAGSPHALETSFLWPPVESAGGGGSGSGGAGERYGVPFRGIDLAARWRVRPASIELRLTVTARWQDAVEVPVAWRLDADFADLQQAAAGEPGPGSTVRAGGRGAIWTCAHPELPLETEVEALGAPWRWRDGAFHAVLELRRQRSAELTLRVHALDLDDPIGTDDEEERERCLDAWRSRVARVGAPGGDAFVDLAGSGMDELGSMALLDGPRDEWLAPAAGLPYYPAFFARDALTAGWQASALDRGDLLLAAHSRACRLQGTRHDPWRDEQPGRVVQQVRRGPLARLGEVPFDRYYGDYASPLMLVISLGQAYAWSGDRDALARRWEPAMAVLDWARRHGDLDGDGYLEYRTLSPHGPAHQGWKDSDNAVVDERGEQVEPPFASCELQGYWYAALQIAAVLAAVLCRWRTARRLWREAAELKRRFDRDFWLEDEGFVAFGLAGESDDPRRKRRVRTLTSNAGHCLASGIVARRRVRRLAGRLLSPELFSGWGIRTLSSDNPSFHPFSYHLGSVWPVECSTILLGLRRYGLDRHALELAGALRDLGAAWTGGRVPECVGGLDRERWGHPGCYPRANAPQAWNLSAWPLLVQSLLGLQPLAPLGTLAVSPLLPAWLPELELTGLRVGDAEVDLRFRRDRRGRSRFRVLRKRGRLRVVRQPPLDDLGASALGRLGALLRRS